MTADLPPLPDGPPLPEVIYTPEEAVAWIRTMTPEALVKASREKPALFPRSKPGREVGFSGADILAIIAGSVRTTNETGTPPKRRGRRGPVALVPGSGAQPGRLTAKPQAARRRTRKAS